MPQRLPFPYLPEAAVVSDRLQSLAFGGGDTPRHAKDANGADQVDMEAIDIILPD
eukprot:gene506-676_t